LRDRTLSALTARLLSSSKKFNYILLAKKGSQQSIVITQLCYS
jgi:hypothetical protein